MTVGVIGTILALLLSFFAAYSFGKDKGKEKANKQNEKVQHEIALDLVNIMADKAAEDVKAEAFYTEVKQDIANVRVANTEEQAKVQKAATDALLNRMADLQKKWERK